MEKLDFNFGSITKFVITGLYAIVAGYFCFFTQTDISGLITAISSIINFSVFLIVCFFIGLLMHAFKISFSASVLSKFRRNIENNPDKKMGLFTYWILRDTIPGYCERLNEKETLKKPDWIAFSLNPVRSTETLQEMLVSDNNVSEKKELFFFTEMFQELSVVNFFLSLASIGVFIFLAVTGNWNINLLIKSGIFIAAYILTWLGALGCLGKYLENLELYKTVRNKTLSSIIKNKEDWIKAYICIRTKGRIDLLKEALKSAISQEEIFKEIVVLADGVRDEKELRTFLDEFCSQNKDTHINKVFLQGAPSPARASRSILSHVISLGRPKDVVFLLDDDDKFHNSRVIYDTVLKMNRLSADVCLLNFSIQNYIDNNIVIDSGNIHNSLVSWIASNNKGLSASEIPDIRHAASMFWTKVSRVRCLRKYLKIFMPDNTLTKYEDFPSFALLLLKEIKITAIDSTSYIYNKQPDSVTFVQNADDFRIQRIGFLNILIEGIRNNEGYFIPEAKELLTEYLEFKITEILTSVLKNQNVVKQLGEKYNPDMFKRDLNELVKFDNEIKQPTVLNNGKNYDK